MVRYQAKPERGAENQQVIQEVSAQLDERKPEGFILDLVRQASEA